MVSTRRTLRRTIRSLLEKQMSQTKNNPNPKKPTDGVLPKVETAPISLEKKPVDQLPGTPLPPIKDLLNKQPEPGATAQPLKLPATKAQKKRQRIEAKANVPVEVTVEGAKYTFTLPTDATVNLASHNVGWIGREGKALRAHICLCEAGAVILMPQTDGTWKANTFSAGNITVAK